MATDAEVEKLITSLEADTKGFEKGMVAAQDVTRKTQNVIEKSGKELQGFYDELKTLATETQVGIESIGAEKWFKSLTTEIQIANTALGDFSPAVAAVTKPITAATDSLSRWTDIYKGFTGTLGEKSLMEKAGETWTKVTDFIRDGAIAAATAVVTGAKAAASAVTAGIASVTAAVAASPLVFVVAAAAIVTAIALVVGTIMRLRAEAEATDKYLEEVKKKNEAGLKTQRETFRADQDKSDTLRGEAKAQHDLSRLEKLYEDYEKVEEKMDRLQAVRKNYGVFDRLFSWTDPGRRLDTGIKVEQEKLDQMEKEEEKILKEMFQKPIRDISEVHKGYTEEKDLLGLTGEQRTIRKVENQLKDLKKLRDTLVEDFDWDPDFNEQVIDMDRNIKETEIALRRMKGAAGDLDQGRAVQRTKDEFEGLEKSLEAQIDKLKYAGDEWEIYHLKKNAEDRGAELGEHEEEALRTLLTDKKILESRKRLQSDAEQMVKRFASPATRYQEEMAKILDIQDSAHPMDEETMTKAVLEVTKQFNAAELAAAKAAAAVTQFDAAVMGSAEASKRLAEYRVKSDLMRLAEGPPNVVRPGRERTSEETWMDEMKEAADEAFQSWKDEQDAIAAGNEFDRQWAEHQDTQALIEAGRDVQNMPWSGGSTGRTLAETIQSNLVDPVVEKLQSIWDTLQAIEDNSEWEDADLGV